MLKKAKDKKLQPDEMSGNTFTISNLGMFGIEEAKKLFISAIIPLFLFSTCITTIKRQHILMVVCLIAALLMVHNGHVQQTAYQGFGWALNSHSVGYIDLGERRITYLGFFNDPNSPVTSSPAEMQRYLSKISGPLLDRIDIHIEVTPVPFEKLTEERKGESSVDIRKRVTAAREIQSERFSSFSIVVDRSSGEGAAEIDLGLGGSATLGGALADYAPRDNDFTFADGETTKQFFFDIIQDVREEPTETVIFDLSVTSADQLTTIGDHRSCFRRFKSALAGKCDVALGGQYLHRCTLA